MVIKKIISEISKKHSVDYVLVSAGKGTFKVQIRKIDGQAYKGVEGNKEARLLAGRKLSEKQVKQRATANRSVKIGKKERAFLRRHNKKISKNPYSIKVSLKKYRQRKKYSSRKEIQKQLRNSEKHWAGYAYEENVKWFMGAINDSGFSDQWAPVYDYLYFNTKRIEDNSLNDAHNKFYEAGHAYQSGNMEKVLALGLEALSLLREGTAMLK